MKKIIYALIAFLILTLGGCSNTQLSGKESEIVFSKNSISVDSNKTYFINIEMISGQNLFDEFAGAFQGNNWVGEYQVRVYTDEFDLDSTVYLAPISINDNQPMNFNGKFSLAFDDYNNDGNFEFTLGQYCSSNGYEYALFSVDQTGKVEKLDTGGLMFISERDYSIKLEKLSPTSFKKSAYDNSIGKTIEKIFIWEENKFITVDPEDLIPTTTRTDDTERYVTWYADLTHDGKTEKIVVDLFYTDDANITTGEEQTISVYKVEDNEETLLWWGYAYTVHAGWNGYYLYTDKSGYSYILNWVPSMSTGIIYYSFEIFSFDENGEKKILDSGSFESTDIKLAYEYQRLDEFVQFIQYINRYLIDSVLLIDTDGGYWNIGSADNNKPLLYYPTWIFNP